MIETPRLFVAVPLDEAARGRVEALVETVRATEPEGGGVRWVRLEGVHVTLRFLGPTPETRLPDIVAAVRAAAASSGRMRIRIAGAGSFPSRDRPRTLWLGVTDGADGLAALASRLDDGLVDAGWERERRPFRAHLTLARADGARSGPAAVAALTAAAEGVAIDAAIDRIVLYESITGSGRARYVTRAEAALG